MLNKITPQKFHKSNSNSTYYRSIRYRINTTNFLSSQKSYTLDHNNKTQLRTLNPSLTKRTEFNSTGKVSKLKRYATIQNQQSNRKTKKMSYLQTWRTLLDKVQFKGIQCKIQSKTQTSNLPSIKEFQQSQFTILDPMNISIDYVQKQFNRTTLEVSKFILDVKKLKGELMNLKEKVECQLEQSSQLITQKINKLKQQIVIDSIKQQQINLRNKRICKDLIYQEKQFKKNFQNSKQSIEELQETIFSSKPSDLIRNEKKICQNDINNF